MSHYFYDDAFDYVSNDGDFGYIIQEGNGNTSTISGVTEEYVIEVHYLGSAVTTLKLDVSNITHNNTLSDLYYVEKGYHDSLRSNPDGELQYDYNTPLATSDTAAIIAGGGTSWGLEQGGVDPHLGLIEIHIPATLTHEQQIQLFDPIPKDIDSDEQDTPTKK